MEIATELQEFRLEVRQGLAKLDQGMRAMLERKNSDQQHLRSIMKARAGVQTSLNRVAIDASAASTPSTQAKWSSAEFRRLLRQLALQFNGDRARAFPGGGASSLEPGVFYGFEDAVRARRRWPSNFASARGHDIPHNSFRHTGASSRPGAARGV